MITIILIRRKINNCLFKSTHLMLEIIFSAIGNIIFFSLKNQRKKKLTSTNNKISIFSDTIFLISRTNSIGKRKQIQDLPTNYISSFPFRPQSVSMPPLFVLSYSEDHRTTETNVCTHPRVRISKFPLSPLFSSYF